MPKKSPIATDTQNASTTEVGDTTGVGKPEVASAEIFGASRASRAPTAMPSAPPSPLSTMASMRNCIKMSRRRAPIALRMPISRVRSVTVTSMMFMIPIPPTTSDIPAIAPSTRVSAVEIEVAWFRMSCWLCS